jgi:two-component system sensor histidine kinase/response regulator
MDSYQVSILRRTLSLATFEELYSLWQEMGAKAGQDAILITEGQLPSHQGEQERFCLLLSPGLSTLLTGHPSSDGFSYEVSLTWEGEAIASWIAHHPHLGAETREFQLPQPSPQTALENQFTLKLLDILSKDSLTATQPRTEEVLRQQVAQERLLNQVIAQIRQSLDLSVILTTAVKEVRSFLQVDRLVIYQFIYESNSHSQAETLLQSWGKITYESRASQDIPSLLNLRFEDECFSYAPHYREKYFRGLIVGVEDVEKAYSSSFCLAEFLRQHHVRSKLIAPIVVQGKVWGLLIAHQCFQKRQWLDSEKNFLGKIGEHLAVAIYQAELYFQVQKQKNTFEQRVIERTQALRDTLLAAQSASRSKSAFLGSMSHELRTPLTCVIGLSGTLLHWSETSNSLPLEKQKQYLQTIQDSGKQLLELINEILDFSQLEAGKSILNIREFSLHQLCGNVLQSLQEKAKEEQIYLHLDFQVDLARDKFWADTERVQQILFHLLSNAIKFTPPGGHVILRAWREQHEVVFQVEDTGIGISEENLPLLFERFEQLEKFLQRTHGGTGLGLALTKQLIDLHQGRIEVESILEKGSLFTVWLPNQYHRILKDSLPKPRPSLTYTLTEGKTIVLLEQDEELATLVCQLLTAANYQIVWLIDSSTAISTIELLQPTAVIVDQQVSNVYHISQTLKSLKTTRGIKILLLSHQITSSDWQKLSQKGVDDYLIKPIQPNLLLQRINALISQEKNNEL